MIQDVKLGTHRIGICMPSVSVRSCSAFVWKMSSEENHQKSNNVGVATRRAQIVWPMMTVTVTNFEGFTRQRF